MAELEPPGIRRARPGDGAALLEIYGPVVLESATSFEEVVPGVEEFEGRIAAVLETHDWLVAEIDGRVVGYAYASSHRARAAYRYSVETSVYLDPAAQGRGIGSALYHHLFELLAGRGFRHAYAGIVPPNPASIALHEKVGFVHIGTFPSVGFKFGRWHDVRWYHRPIDR